MAVIDPSSSRILVFHVVTHWLGPQVGLPAEKINVSRTFSAAPPNGYGMVPGAYMSMCDDITQSLIIASGRQLVLTPSWREQHIDDVIAAFINATAVLLASAAMTPVGVSALTWSMQPVLMLKPRRSRERKKTRHLVDSPALDRAGAGSGL